ncbi:DNA/RNA non-specific endonuclease [Spirosoma aerolatum]|uniref:DNA/RNA non-specific endonuclease n=1 Tax=Spirosoma aerolatum TaxID=1211326 RepID=UPI0009ADB1C7|nr:DNA/RNA non-specific endonuclease [Spirosoma aerolatum]
MQLVPKVIQKAVRQRLMESIPDQQETLKKIEEGKPLEAEKDENRKLAYIQRQVKCSLSVARRIADREDPANLPLNDDQRNKAESLQGDTADFVPICFLDIGRAASRSVAIVTLPDRSPKGTGFMVSPSLFLTNQHVIPSSADARNRLIEFTYELDPDKQTTPVTQFQLDPDTFYLNDSIDDLDYALVAIGPKRNGPLSVSELGFLPLVDANDKWITAGFVNIIQHPNGEFKQLVVRENRITTHSNNTLIYGTDTLPGSSGSPVFNDDWEVLALHHWGEPHRAIADLRSDGLPIPGLGNEGIRISAIIKELIDKLPTLTKAQQNLLSEALNPGFRHPSLLGASVRQPEATRAILPDPPPDPKPQLSKTPQAMLYNASNGTVSFTVPITISLSFGQVEQTVRAVSPEKNEPQEVSPEDPGAAEAIVFKPAPDYSNRKGYDPTFLGIVLPLPGLTGTQPDLAAINKQALPNRPFEFTYQNFSLVMNKKRRLPFFTAVNIDGGSVVQINRQTGAITRNESEGLEEARETWYDDPRIDPKETTQDTLYRTADFRIFQRGHLVKRTDPSWGGAERAFKGQSDTFHFTNCSPQHEKFNPINTRWAGVEDWITRVSDNENIRVTVFSGPVFGDNDPLFSNLPVPKQFWKVIVWSENGKIRSTSILADQGDLLQAAQSGREGLDDPNADSRNKFPKTYHVSIKTIEKLTGLDFGNDVRRGDSAPRGGESLEFSDVTQLQPIVFPDKGY